MIVESRMEHIDKYWDLIERHSLFRGLVHGEIASAMNLLRGEAQSFDKGEHLDKSIKRARQKRIGCVLSGWAEIYKYDLRGNRVMLDFIMPNYLIGCYDVFSCVRLDEFEAIATAPGILLTLDAQELSAPSGVSNTLLISKLQSNLISILTERSWRLLKKDDILSAGTQRDKLLLYLSYESAYFGSTSFDLPFDRQDMANYLHMNRSSLSRELGKLRNEGLIEFSHNHFRLNFQPPK